MDKNQKKIDSLKAFARVCEAPRTEDEMEFLARLFQDQEDDLPLIASVLPKGPLTVDSMLESFSDSNIGFAVFQKYENSSPGSRDERTAKLIILQVKLMGHLMKTEQELFMMFVSLLDYFGRISFDNKLQTVVNISYDAMVVMLQTPKGWRQRNYVETSDKVKKSGELKPDSFSPEDQIKVIEMINSLDRAKGTSPAFKLASLLLKKSVIGTEAISAYRISLEKRYEENVEKYAVYNGPRPKVDVALNTFALARIEQLCPVEILDHFVELSGVNDYHG